MIEVLLCLFSTDYRDIRGFRKSLGHHFRAHVMAIQFRSTLAKVLSVTFFATTAEALSAACITEREQSITTVSYVPIEFRERVCGFVDRWDVPIAEASGESSVNAVQSDCETKKLHER